MAYAPYGAYAPMSTKLKISPKPCVGKYRRAKLVASERSETLAESRGSAPGRGARGAEPPGFFFEIQAPRHDFSNKKIHFIELPSALKSTLKGLEQPEKRNLLHHT